jgi:ribosomal protein L1
MAKHGKKIKSVKEKLDLTKKYTLQEAVELLQKQRGILVIVIV